MNANPDDIRAAYRRSIDEIRMLCDLWLEQAFARVDGEWVHPIGSPGWNAVAERVDRMEIAASTDGWGGSRRGRMILLGAVEDAAWHQDRLRHFAPDYALAREAHEREAWTPSAENAIERLVRLRTWRDASVFEQVSDGIAAHEEPVLFAAHLFERRCAKYSPGLVSAKALAALSVAIKVCRRGRGQPRKGAERLPQKREAFATLCHEAGLGRVDPKTLETEWASWRKLHPEHDWSPPSIA